ncbi:hypothetical protein A0H81_10487 [Grifola frondosa]|uniref:Uncharacterized protein n=1 Tax=Grifola frondosa TaxID=5627 RepID=A0A1C7LYN7_GRIFR|nr:hypothetical protein A0H81_10487 [Grifola frondosa]
MSLRVEGSCRRQLYGALDVPTSSYTTRVRPSHNPIQKSWLESPLGSKACYITSPDKWVDAPMLARQTSRAGSRTAVDTES